MKYPTKNCQACGGTGKEINHWELGKLMRVKREKAGVGLRQISRAMHYSAPFISDIERGQRRWNVRLIEEYELALAGCQDKRTKALRKQKEEI